jgi:hypothetical protein
MYQNIDLRFFHFTAFVKKKSRPFFRFFDLTFYCLFSFFYLVFLSPFVFPLFFTLVLYIFFFAHVVSSLAYLNLLGNKRLLLLLYARCILLHLLQLQKLIRIFCEGAGNLNTNILVTFAIFQFICYRFLL